MNPAAPDRWFVRRLRAFADAGRGVVFLIRYESASRVHLAFSAFAIGLAVWLGFSPVEWAVLCITIGLVWSAEAFNTSVEKLCDALHPQPNPAIGKVKDLAAGAVLLSALAAVAVGVALFGPRLWPLIFPD